MRLSGYQPQYFPRLHFFARALDSDIFEISDYLQFVKKHAYPMPDGRTKRGKSFQSDTPIKLHQGESFLTIPVQRKRLLPLTHTTIEYGQPWQEKHLASIRSGYGKAVNFNSLYPEISAIIQKQHDSLSSLNVSTFLWALTKILGIRDTDLAQLSVSSVNRLLEKKHPFRLRKIVLISETNIEAPDDDRDATDWIIDMCRIFGANEYYYGGTSAAAYMNFEKLKRRKISLIEQHWVCQPYRQQFPKFGFLPNLSILDLLLNEHENTITSCLSTRNG
ncbi:MAG: hypothetical protein A2785_01015 [Candidatus Chisholmbacteria bacterium RIFCSPHIGHO2_01_FULL_49_18]|uniref:WbqC-like protein n=2 Tax=Candidatus Chisholmiibacteriota TaxID=1817900 RepID=A0A1G1VLC0_9BACT|nr:MAG: hypothetical protein A2785_01015 [Candidatus Chisholmbacteria bacterium RIFCSPHIGHO2_01_FULL_49_18]OGY22138.1 MAG: hypothetical protein A3A65_01535 [Candidatus Chisholmbacteria bacterium RIFCSPLOWO2_01_FULL_49_14]